MFALTFTFPLLVTLLFAKYAPIAFVPISICPLLVKADKSFPYIPITSLFPVIFILASFLVEFAP